MSFTRAVCGVLICALVLFSQSAFAISYKYDVLGRLIEVTYDSGRIVSYAYDPAGNRIEHLVEFSSEFSINDSIATLGIGNNLIDLSGWPMAKRQRECQQLRVGLIIPHIIMKRVGHA